MLGVFGSSFCAFHCGLSLLLDCGLDDVVFLLLDLDFDRLGLLNQSF
jgi:hypothetical protein